MLTALCACSSGAGPAADVDPTPLAISACRTVDGADPHTELSGDMAAQLDAQATDREAASSRMSQPAANTKYAALSQDMVTLATQSRGVATDFKSDPAAMAQRLLGANGGLGDYISALVAARSACQALGLPTK